MTKRFIALLLTCLMVFSCTTVFAKTYTFSGQTFKNFDDTCDAAPGGKNDNEQKFYYTMDGGTVGKSPNYSVFGGRSRRSSNDVAVSYYETVNYQCTGLPFSYISYCASGADIYLRYKCDSSSPTKYMNVYGKYTN